MQALKFNFQLAKGQIFNQRDFCGVFLSSQSKSKKNYWQCWHRFEQNSLTLFYSKLTTSFPLIYSPAARCAIPTFTMLWRNLSLTHGTTRRVLQDKFPQKPCNKSFIGQSCSVKMAEYWRSFLRQKNLANIQPSWPHTWSITHILLV